MIERLSIIAALDEKRGIGKEGKIPWHIPEEQKRFRDITNGYPIIMGRKTHESIGRVLPGRLNIIVTKDPNYQAKEGSVVVHSLEDALERTSQEGAKEVFVIGGGEIYNQALGITNRLYLSLIPGDYDADTHFPDYSDFKNIVLKEEHGKYNFFILERD